MRRINSTSTKTYASRTILFLRNNGTLKPLAIELSLPHPEGDHNGAISKVYLPAELGVEKSLWQLAKAYVVVVDSGYHQLVSHWYNSIRETKHNLSLSLTEINLRRMLHVSQVAYSCSHGANHHSCK